MYPKKRNSIAQRCIALILAVAMIFTGTVAYADSSWEESYLDVKDGVITKGELHDRFAAQFGSGSYKYAESKPRYGWGTGGTEVKSGNGDTVTLKHNQTYAVGKKGRYTWTASSDYAFTARVYYVLTAADANLSIANEGKIYKDSPAEITVIGKTGFHAQVWFDDKLQMTIEDGETTGTFTPNTSGEVSVVYVEASKPKHQVTLDVIGEEFGSASLDFSGAQQEGTPITLTATPENHGYIADISINGAEFTTLSGFDENRGKVGTFDVAASDVKVAVTFAQQTAGFDTNASYDADGNLEVYVNTEGEFDFAHIEESLFTLLAVDPSVAKPASKDLVQIQFLSIKPEADSVWRDLDFKAPTGDWAWMSPAYGYAEFPQSAGETAKIRISWDATEQYPAGSIEQQIVLADHRIPTVIEGNDAAITYGATDAELLEALNLSVNGADGTNPASATDLTLTYNGPLDVDGSPHKVKVSYGGNADYQPSKAEFNVTVKKAPCTIHYGSQVVTYGDAYSLALEKHPEDVDTINFMIGLDVSKNASSDHMPVTHIYLELPDSLGALNTILDTLLNDDHTVSLEQLLPALKSVIKNYSSYLESQGISTEAVESILNTLNSVTENIGALDNVKVTINPKGGFHPTNIGMYLVGAVTADNNYETAYTLGYLVIAPKGVKADLKYRYEEVNGIVTQNLLLDGIYDLGADAYIDDAIHQAATGYVDHFFLKIGQEGNIDFIYANSNEDLATHISSGELTKTGTYQQISFMPLDNEMYYSMPLARTYIVMEDGVNVQFIDSEGKVDIHQEFQYDGQPKGMDVRVTMKDGTVLPNDERLTVRYIGVDAKGITFYHDTKRPVNVGAYKVIATYNDPETGLVGMAAGTMMITSGSVAVNIVGGTFEYDENYTVQVNTTPEGIEKIVAIIGMSTDGDIIEGEVGMINVDLPKRIDRLMKIMLPLVYYNGINVQDLMDLIDQLKDILSIVGIDGSVIDQLTGTVTGLMEELGIDLEKADITFKDTEDVKPLPIGTYTAVGISCDINHEIGVMNMGMINIIEKTIEQRKIVITVDDVEKTYGEKDPEFKWSYEVTGKTENGFYEDHDLEQVVVGGTSGVEVVNLAGEHVDVGVYKDKLYPRAYINPEYQKYYTIEAKSGTMTVLQKDISQDVKIEGISDKTYTGQAIEQKSMVVKLGQISLIPGTDYEVAYEDNIHAGQATMTIRGIGNYSGSASAGFVIQPKLIEDADVSKISDKTYNGETLTPEVAIVVDGVTLKNGEDYIVAFENNKDAGQAKAVITGLGNYTTDDGSRETIERTFNIKPASLSAEIEKTNYVYDGTAKEPAVTVKDAVRDVDYTVTYHNNINAGRGNVIVEGTGNYSGRFESTFNIAKAPLTIMVQPAEKFYGEANPEFKVQYEGLQGTDTEDVIRGLRLDCIANENSAVGSYLIAASGASADNYSIDYVDGRLTIKAKSLSGAAVTCPEKTYNGKAQKPATNELTVTVDGVKLKENIDFQIVGYENNIDVGTASVLINGIGNYADTVKGEFQIMPAQLPAADLQYKQTTYDGKAKEPKVTIKGLKEGTDFTVAYKDNTNAGTATVSITGIGNYTGTAEKTFVIDKARDSITLSINGWTYGEPANRPEGNSASGSPLTYQYMQGSKVLEDVPTDAGTYYVRASVGDSDNYTSTYVQKPFTIAKRSITDENITVGEIVNQRYTGQEVKPEVSVYDGYRKADLDADDYSVVYRNNKEIGQASVTIVGKGNYKDSVTTEFSIKEFGFFAAVDADNYIYNGEVQKPVVNIEGYIEGEDYTVTYETDCINAGKHTVVVKGIGKCINYETEILSFYIHKAEVDVIVNDATITYGDAFEPVAETKGLYDHDSLDGTVRFHYYTDETCATEIEKPDSAGTYYVKASGLSSVNYDIRYTAGKLIVQKMENAWLEELTMNGWTYGDQAEAPKAQAKYGEVIYKYFADEACMQEITDITMAEAGTYYVKAFVTEGDNYFGLESESISFVIAAAESNEPEDEPGEDPGDNPEDDPENEPGDEPEDEPGDEPEDEPGEEPEDEPGEEPEDEPGDDPENEPGEEPEDEPGEEPEDEPSDESENEPIEESGDESENELEETPETLPEDNTGTVPEADAEDSDDIPDTGDHNGFAAWAGLLMASLFGVGVLRNRRREDEAC